VGKVPKRRILTYTHTDGFADGHGPPARLSARPGTCRRRSRTNQQREARSSEAAESGSRRVPWLLREQVRAESIPGGSNLVHIEEADDREPE